MSRSSGGTVSFSNAGGPLGCAGKERSSDGVEALDLQIKIIQWEPAIKDSRM